MGENLLSLPFTLLINDINEGYLSANGCTYVIIDNEAFDNSIKLVVLIYADETVMEVRKTYTNP